jgi:hypothetical protein
MCVLVCCGLHALCCPVDPALDMYSNFHVDVSLLPHRLPAAVQAAAALPPPPLKFRLVTNLNHHEPIHYHCLLFVCRFTDSRSGFCGSAPFHCSPGNCLPAWGACDGTPSVSPAVTPSSSPLTECGPRPKDQSKPACGAGRCCSMGGYCGATAAFCDMDAGCQEGYG